VSTALRNWAIYSLVCRWQSVGGTRWPRFQNCSGSSWTSVITYVHSI